MGVRLFGERPYQDVPIDEIAAAAGVSKNLLYHYFPSKRDFFIESVKRGMEEMFRRTGPAPDLPLEESVGTAIDAHLDWVEGHAKAYAAITRGAGADPEVQALVDDYRERVLARGFEWLLGPGATPPPALRLAMLGWFGFVDTVCVDWLERRTVDREEVRELLLSSYLALVSSAISEKLASAPD